MFKKKKKVEQPVTEEATAIEEETTKEEKLIDKTVPDALTAVTVVRDAVRDWVMPICNISKQRRHDIASCLEYLLDYFSDQKEINLSDHLQSLIDNGELQDYSKSYEDNGYKITLHIKKDKNVK